MLGWMKPQLRTSFGTITSHRIFGSFHFLVVRHEWQITHPLPVGREDWMRQQAMLLAYSRCKMETEYCQDCLGKLGQEAYLKLIVRISGIFQKHKRPWVNTEETVHSWGQGIKKKTGTVMMHVNMLVIPVFGRLKQEHCVSSRLAWLQSEILPWTNKKTFWAKVAWFKIQESRRFCFWFGTAWTGETGLSLGHGLLNQWGFFFFLIQCFSV